MEEIDPIDSFYFGLENFNFRAGVHFTGNLIYLRIFARFLDFVFHKMIHVKSFLLTRHLFESFQ